ncbi:MAG: LysM peptidoglycan-binding domain-containing protein [Oscillospiraceae bacterium]|nr:LysM peptidoglycan-binding domain-containing protein [Oscillospiraceae bacterium]
MSYSFFLDNIRLPVAPSKIDVRYANKISRLELADASEIILGCSELLTSISFRALLPWKQYPFAVYTDGFKRGDEILSRILLLKEKGNPFRFIMRRRLGHDAGLSFNIRAVIKEVRVLEDASNGSDIYADIELVEFQEPPIIQTISVPVSTAAFSEPVRPVENHTPQRTYTVVRGDSLWGIAQRFLKSGNRWKEIYELNKAAIDSRNRGTGKVYYTIYPGQIFKLPAE